MKTILELYHTNARVSNSNFLIVTSESSLGVQLRSHKGKYKYTSESSESDCSPRKRKYKPYKQISREFKKIKPPMFNGEIGKG